MNEWLAPVKPRQPPTRATGECEVATLIDAARSHQEGKPDASAQRFHL